MLGKEKTFLKLSYKQRRCAIGIVMMYAFLGLVSMIYIFVLVGSQAGFLEALGFFSLWFFQPLALIALTYHMLMKIYPYKEKT